jgi:DNA replication protein DnaC
MYSIDQSSSPIPVKSVTLEGSTLKLAVEAIRGGIHEASDVIILGPGGAGKTHLSVALAEEAIRSGLGAYFVTAHDLAVDLGRAYREGRLDRRMRVYLVPKVLVIDEVGYLPLDDLGATIFF